MTLFLEVLLRSSLVLAAGFAARRVFARSGGAAQRHVLMAASLFAAVAVIPLASVVPALGPRIPGEVVPVFAVPRPSDAPSRPGQSAAGSSSTVRGNPLEGRSLPALPSFATVWIAGSFAGALMLVAGMWRVRRIARRAAPVTGAAWQLAASELAQTAGLRRPVALLRTDTHGVLATSGLLRPRILLPSHAEGWPEERRRVVLAHELAHVARADWAIQIAAELARVLLWFNPLAWIACAMIRRDAECACDDEVLARGVPPATYAAELVALVRLCRPAAPAGPYAIPMANPSTLERRITAMLNPLAVRTPRSRSVTAVAVVFALGLVIPVAGLRATQTGPATLSGVIYDATGGVMPGVQVALEGTNEAKWSATTNATGRFDVPGIYPGAYTLSVAVPGFKALKQQFDLRNSRDWDRAITLQLGDLRETITVQETRLTAPAAPQPQFGAPVRVGGNVRAPRKLVDVKPVYPASMRAAGREGVVPIDALIGADGTVTSVRVVSADVHPDFAIAAADAVRQWRFSPTMLNGKPVEVVMTVSVTFSLRD